MSNVEHSPDHDSRPFAADHHAGGNDDHQDDSVFLRPVASLLQLPASIRIAGSIGLLLPLWIAVYGLVAL